MGWGGGGEGKERKNLGLLSHIENEMGTCRLLYFGIPKGSNRLVLAN
jgi:hypothetical protein